MFKRSLVLPLAVLPLTMSLLSACTNSNSALTDASGANIVNGTLVTEMTEIRSSTVLLVSVKPDKSASICTGTLIAPNLVLSAGHCAPKKEDAANIRTLVGFGINIPGSFGKDKKYAYATVTQYIVNKDYAQGVTAVSNSKYDLAMFKFEGAIPAEFKIRELPSADFKIQDTDNLEMIGYGTTAEGTGDAGTLRTTEVSAAQISANIEIQNPPTEVPAPGTIIVKQPTTGVCTGDSGGPLFVRNQSGQLTYVGVTSLGVDTIREEGKKQTCHGASLFVDLREQLTWIQQTAEALNK